MGTFASLLSAVALAAAGAAGPALAQAPAQVPVQPPAAAAEAPYAYPVESHFGLFSMAEGKPMAFRETDAIPNKPGQQYGWFIKLSTNKPAVRVREEIQAPGRANWTSDE